MLHCSPSIWFCSIYVWQISSTTITLYHGNFFSFFLLSRFNLHCSLDIDSVGSFTHCFLRLSLLKSFLFLSLQQFYWYLPRKTYSHTQCQSSKSRWNFCFRVSIHSPICFCSILFLFTSMEKILWTKNSNNHLIHRELNTKTWYNMIRKFKTVNTKICLRETWIKSFYRETNVFCLSLYAVNEKKEKTAKCDILHLKNNKLKAIDFFLWKTWIKFMFYWMLY